MVWDLVRWLAINTAVVFTGSYLAFRPTLWAVSVHAVPARVRLIVVFSALAVVSMLMPWEPMPGILVDLRAVVVGFAGWLGGWQVGLPVAIVAALMRWGIGGDGALGGVVGVALAGVVGALMSRRPRTPLNLFIFASACAAALYAGGLFVAGRPPVVKLSGYYSPIIALLFHLSSWMLHWVFTEMEERHRLQRSLQQELRLNEAVLETVPSGVVLVGDDGRVRKANGSAGLLFQTDGDLVGRPLAGLLPDALKDKLGKGEPIANVRVAVDGRYLVFHSATLENGGAVISVQDVTRVVREEQEDAHRKRLELLGELAATAAHEVKNPLTTIKGFLQLLTSKSEFQRYERELGLLQGEVEQINRVVSDLLLLSRSRPDDFQPVDIAALVDEVFALAAIQYPEANVSARSTVEPGSIVWSDRKACKQILLNLCANAYDAMEGEGALHVLARHDGDWVIIDLQDSGPGIPPDLLPDLFRPYVTTKPSGTGLGLAICSKLATDLGGEITVRTGNGPGATFSLRLPAPEQPARLIKLNDRP